VVVYPLVGGGAADFLNHFRKMFGREAQLNSASAWSVRFRSTVSTAFAGG
jgi:hypothetical protein